MSLAESDIAPDTPRAAEADVVHMTDAVIIGAGPAGLFAVFTLGLADVRTHILDTSETPGGQCAGQYPDSTIYDVPGWPAITGQGLIDRLKKQIEPFDPVWRLEQTATELTHMEDGHWRVVTDTGAAIVSPTVVIAAGGAPAEPFGLDTEGEGIAVSPETFETSAPGVFAIGDIAAYPGKQKLILSGFHEAALMARAAFRYVHPGRELRFEHTASSGHLQEKLGVKD